MTTIGKVTLAAACLIATVPVFAQQAGEEQPKPAAVIPVEQQPTDAQMAKLFEVMRVKEQLAASTKMMPVIMQQQMKQQFGEIEKDHPEMQSMTPQQRDEVTAIMGKFMQKAMSLYTSDEMLGDMAAVYKKHLTGMDVDAAVAFYGTPAGQHMLDMNSAVLTEFTPVVMQKMQARMRPAGAGDDERDARRGEAAGAGGDAGAGVTSCGEQEGGLVCRCWIG